jgi:hypothetical protein
MATTILYNHLKKLIQLMPSNTCMVKTTALAAISAIMVWGCTVSRKNGYHQYSVTTRLKHNDSLVQKIFGEKWVDYFLTDSFIVVQQPVEFSEDSIIHKTPKYNYFIINRLEGKQQAAEVYDAFEAKVRGKEYTILSKDSIQRQYLFKGFLNMLELDKYQQVTANRQADGLMHSFSQKGANMMNKRAADSVVLVTSLRKDRHFPFHLVRDNRPITQFEMYEKIEGSQFNVLVVRLTKGKKNYHSATLDSLLNKYKNKL